jgi:hypothetical protein
MKIYGSVRAKEYLVKNILRLLSLLMVMSLLMSGCAGANAIPEAGNTDNTEGTGKVIEYEFTSRLENGYDLINSSNDPKGAVMYLSATAVTR